MKASLAALTAVVPVVALLAAASAPSGPAAAGVGPRISYTYVVRGLDNRSSLDSFATAAAATYADGRGWNLGGSIAFRRVSSGGNFTLWLAAAADLPRFGSPCDSAYSCTNGTNVVINETRWLTGSPAWNATGASLADYRHMVVNHETGHWLGFGHEYCAGPGQLAPVMQQQSISLQGCRPNAWPTTSERQRLAATRGVPIVTGDPFGHLDAVTPGLAALAIRGWSIDPDTVAAVRVSVRIDYTVLSVLANSARSDVAAAYPGYGRAHGFVLNRNVTPGPHTVCVTAANLAGSGGSVRLGCRVVYVSGTPIGRLDSVSLAGPALQVQGWALDPDTRWAIPVVVVETPGGSLGVIAGQPRADLIGPYPRWGPAHGFSVRMRTSSGLHQVCAYALNRYGVGATGRLGCSTVRVP